MKDDPYVCPFCGGKRKPSLPPHCHLELDAMRRDYERFRVMIGDKNVKVDE